MATSADELLDLLRQPIPLTPNRVYRFYKGGALIAFVAPPMRGTPTIQRIGLARSRQLLGGKTAEFLGATRLDVSGEMPIDGDGFYIGIVTSGTGVLTGTFGDTALEAGDSFVCSAAVSEHAFTPKASSIWRSYAACRRSSALCCLVLASRLRSYALRTTEWPHIHQVTQ
jgi:hypothetical protein